MQATCAHCGEPYTPRTSNQRCCSRRCSAAYFRNSGGQCGEPGCTRTIRAKGLCVTHYNRHLQPDRHPKVEVLCGQCGTPVTKAKDNRFERRYCSAACRTLSAWSEHREEKARQRKLPVLWQRPAIVQPTPVKRATVWTAGRCRICAAPFVDVMPHARYCSQACGRRHHRRNRRVRTRSAVGSWTQAEFMAVFAIFGHCCAYCEQAVIGTVEPDHVLALARGGSNSISNLLPACGPCNRDKNDMTLNEWPIDRAWRGLPGRTTTWQVDDPRVRHLELAAPHGPSRIDRPAFRQPAA